MLSGYPYPEKQKTNETGDYRDGNSPLHTSVGFSHIVSCDEKTLVTFSIMKKKFLSYYSPKNLPVSTFQASVIALYLSHDILIEVSSFRIAANKHFEGSHKGGSGMNWHLLAVVQADVVTARI